MARLRNLLAALAAVAVCCTLGPDLAGTSEQGNARVIGSLYTQSGGPASGAVVQLVPAAWNPVADGVLPEPFITTCSVQGVFSFSALPSGNYNIECFLGSDLTGALISDIAVNHDTSTVSDTLKLPGEIRVLFDDSSNAGNRYVYLPGTTLWARVQNSSATISDVPAGQRSGVYYRNTADPATDHAITNGFTVSSGAVTMIADMTTWKYSKRLYLNTTATGANVTNDVHDFPVLVRLTDGNFNFSEARPDGADLRFTKADNATPLPYEIESWNSSVAAACIWVRVDTVFGNDSSHSIIMHWGTSTGTVHPSQSNGPAVFNSTNGCQGVWHLSSTPNGSADDATPNNFDGTPSDTAPVPVPGMVGGAQEFNGSSSYFIMKGTSAGALDFPENGTYSISAWAYTDTLDGGFHTIIGRGGYGYNLEIVFFDAWEFAEYKNMAGWEMTTSAAFARQWVYLTGVRKGTHQYLYVNGQCVDSAIEILPPKIPQPRNSSAEVTIGKIIWPANDFTPYFYDGRIDEVRIANVAQSADWIKLCYNNQKEEDKLVVFK